MTSELGTSDGHRPAAPSRARTAVENLLPAGIVRRRSSRPPAIPHMERSVSSMADSFVDYWGQCSRNPPDIDGAKTPDLVATKEDGLTPISNWAHLNYMKTQRNTLRTQLKAQQVAGAEAKRSVASLRRLAFRMAVNISVKERQIATSARNLAKNRKSNYLEGRGAERRVEELKRALRVEEGRNKEILEALERASMLTLQYANPTDRPRNVLSPPPSPPVRQSSLSMTALDAPRTPPRSTSSSWNDADWELTPGLKFPNEIRTSDSRLIRAKRESDQALSACRRRINDLQAECARGKQVGETLEASKISLEKKIDEHQVRIASLEEARAKIEETLDSTRLQLEVSTGLEDGLKQILRMKKKELTSLQQSSEDRQKRIEELQKEKNGLLAQLKERDTELQERETRTSTLEKNLELLQDKLNTAASEESSLRDRLKEKESANEELQKRLDRGSKYEQILQKKIAEHEQETLGNVKKIEIGGGIISSLREQIEQSENKKRDFEKAFTTLRAELSNLEACRGMEVEEHSRLVAELRAVHLTKNTIEEDLLTTKTTLEQNKTDKTRLQSELDTLCSSRNKLHGKLQHAESRVRSLERIGEESQAKFELLRDEKASIEADLKDARQTLFSLRESERMNKSDLAELRLSEKGLQQTLQQSRKEVSILENELKQARKLQVAADTQREEELQRHTKQYHELQLSIASLQATLESSEKLKASVQGELGRFRSSKTDIETRLNDTLRSKTNLQTELDTVRSTLEQTTNESEHLKIKVAELEGELSTSWASRADVEAHLISLHNERDSFKTLASELKLALNDSSNAKSQVEESLRIAQLDGETSVAEVAGLLSQLNEVQESKEEAELKLTEVIVAKSDLEDQLRTAQSRLVEIETAEGHIQSELSSLQEEISETKRAKTEVEERFQMSQAVRAELQAQLQSTQSRLHAIESDATALRLKLVTCETELETSQHQRTEVENQLKEAQATSARLEGELSTARQKKMALESDLISARTQLADLESNSSKTTTRLSDKDEELNTLRQHLSEAERKLSEALATTTTLEKELDLSRHDLKVFESRHTSLIARIASTDQELANLREHKSQAGKQSESQASSGPQLLDSLESEKVSLITDAQKTEYNMADLRDANVKLEESIRQASQDTTDSKNELHAARVRIEAAEAEITALNNELEESNNQAITLREANSRLTESEEDLFARLATAEEELHTVQETNKRLEAFLERVEQDMAHAETAFEESEKRLEEFVEESQSKLDAARNAKLKYKRRLSERTNEIEILLNENSALHNQVGKQAQELNTLTEGKEQLEGLLTEKESFVNEVKSSSDKRMRSMNSAYNELRSKYEKQLCEQQEDSSKRLEHELQKKNSVIDGLRQDKGEGEGDSAFVALEQEVHALREDKKAFERLVKTLKEKIRHLEQLEESQEPVEEDEVLMPSKAGPRRTRPESIVSTSPSTQHTRSSAPESVLSQPTSIGHPSALNERPTTRASTASKQEDLDAWAREIERIRMLRDEQAIQLRNNRKARNDLKKSMKDSKLQLHQLERQNKSQRHRTLLRKNRPPTGLRTFTANDPDHVTSAPTTPLRPQTATDMSSFSPGTARSRHTIHFSPDTPERPNTSTPLSANNAERPNTSSTPLSSSRRWSTLHRPKISHRPGTSAGAYDDALAERPMTSAGERTTEHKEKKRWGLRRMFR